MGENLSRRAVLAGFGAVAAATAVPLVPVVAEAAPVVVRGPLTLPLLKELSERALPILEKHFPGCLPEHVFMAEEGECYHHLNIYCDCPAERRRMAGDCKCQRHPLAGTLMAGGMSGYETPEWDEETVYTHLCRAAEWSDRPASMSDAEWTETLAIIGMTEAEHANRMAWLDGEIASLDTPTPTPGGLAEGGR